MKLVARIASLLPVLAVVAVVQALWSLPADGQSGRGASRGDGSPEAVVDARGRLHVPSNYRGAYEFLGTWAIAADKGIGSSELHTVYASRGTAAAYHTSGHFPDGTVLIKEVFETCWFVMVNDSKNSHPGNSLWGDGWGWSWFDAANPTKTTSSDYKKNCLVCHVPARDTDWVYVGGYPALK